MSYFLKVAEEGITGREENNGSNEKKATRARRTRLDQIRSLLHYFTAKRSFFKILRQEMKSRGASGGK